MLKRKTPAISTVVVFFIIAAACSNNSQKDSLPPADTSQQIKIETEALQEDTDAAKLIIAFTQNEKISAEYTRAKQRAQLTDSSLVLAKTNVPGKYLFKFSISADGNSLDTSKRSLRIEGIIPKTTLINYIKDTSILNSNATNGDFVHYTITIDNARPVTIRELDHVDLRGILLKQGSFDYYSLMLGENGSQSSSVGYSKEYESLAKLNPLFAGDDNSGSYQTMPADSTQASVADSTQPAQQAFGNIDDSAVINQTGDWKTHLATGLVFLLCVIVIAWATQKLAKNLYTTGETIGDGLQSYFPMVRISRATFFFRRRVVILYNDSIATFRKRKKTSIAALHEDDSKEQLAAFKKISRKKIIPLDGVRKITIIPGRIARLYRYKIKTNAGKFVLVLPEFESHDFIKVLSTLFPGRIKYLKGSFLKSVITGVVIAILLCAVFILSGKYTGSPGPEEEIIIFSTALFIFFIVPLIFILYDKWNLERVSKNKNKLKADLSHRKPLRSNILAFVLRAVAVAILILSLLSYHYYDDSGDPAAYSTLKDNTINHIILKAGIPAIDGMGVPGFFVVMYAAVGFLLSVALAVSQKRTDKLRKNDTRKPILYLRSFLDDNKTTLNPGTSLSNYLGAEPPYYLLDKYGFDSSMKRYHVLRWIITYFYNHHPVRLIRLFFGRPLDTSEEQMANYLKRYGLFVGIGKPGEKIVTPGASRMYVTNEEWQQTVLGLLHESQFVVLQPSATEGVWWEINKVLANCQPQQVILCMVNYKNHQEYYENFYRRFKSLMPGIKLPRSTGNENKITFLAFDAEWNPFVLDMKYYTPVIWPTGKVTNIGSTFKKFLVNLK